MTEACSSKSARVLDEPTSLLVGEGMRLDLPGARERWRQLLEWVGAGLAREHVDFRTWQASAAWKPRTPAEQLEVGFLRGLLSAHTPQDIVGACDTVFFVAGLGSAHHPRIKEVGLDEAFERLAAALQLTDSEARRARQLANALDKEPRLAFDFNPAEFVCARKFTIIRHAVQQAQRLAALVDRAAVAQVAARQAVAELNAQLQDAASKAPAQETYPLGSGRLVVLDAHWQNLRVDGQLFDLQQRAQIKQALRFLWARGCTSATRKRVPVKAVCRAAGQRAMVPNLHAIFHVMGQPTSPSVDYDRLYDLLLDCQRGQGVWLKV